MSTAATTKEGTSEMKDGKPAILIDELTAALAELNASLAASRARQAFLESERGAFVIPARVNRDAKAQARLLAIDEELGSIRRDVADDSAAISDLARKLEDAREALARAEWEQRRAELRKAVRSRMGAITGNKIDAAAAALVEALEEERTKDELLAQSLAEFDSSLRSVRNDIQRCAKGRGTILAAKLREFVPVQLFGREFELRDRSVLDGTERAYREALERLDSLELVA